MSGVDFETVRLVAEQYRKGAKVILRRSETGGRVKIATGPLNLFSRKLDVNSPTLEAIREAMRMTLPG